MYKQPCYRVYYDYSDNYGTNALAFTDSDGNEWFYSYDTLVGACIGGEVVCIINYWNNTTGKHLNAIEPDHKKRLNETDFNAKIEELLNKQIKDRTIKNLQ